VHLFSEDLELFQEFGVIEAVPEGGGQGGQVFPLPGGLGTFTH